MGFLRVFIALLKKNYLIKMRSPLTSLSEIIVPLIFSELMSGLKFNTELCLRFYDLTAEVIRTSICVQERILATY